MSGDAHLILEAVPPGKEGPRVLAGEKQLISWVPFMHSFHGDDLYRYSPPGLRHLLRDFELVAFESSLWVFTVVGSAMIEALKRVRLGFAEWPTRQLCGLLDRLFTRDQKRPASFAAAYRVVARKRDQQKP